MQQIVAEGLCGKSRGRRRRYERGSWPCGVPQAAGSQKGRERVLQASDLDGVGTQKEARMLVETWRDWLDEWLYE